MKLRDKIVAVAITIGVSAAGYFIQREIRPSQVKGSELERIIELQIDPTDDSHVLAIHFNGFNETPQSNLYESNDGGENFTEQGCMDSLVFDKVNPRKAYGTCDNNFLVSNNGARSFKRVNTIENEQKLSAFSDRFQEGKIYIAGSNGDKWGMYVSEDSGKTLRFLDFSSAMVPNSEHLTKNRIIWDVDQDPKNPRILYVTGEQGTHQGYFKDEGGRAVRLRGDPYLTLRTQDAGKTWEAVSAGLKWHCIDVEPVLGVDGQTKWFALSEGYEGYILNEKSQKWEPFVETGSLLNNYIPRLQRDLLLTQTGVYTSFDPNKEWKTLHEDPNARYVNVAINSRGAIILADYKTGIVRINDPTPSLATLAHQ